MPKKAADQSERTFGETLQDAIDTLGQKGYPGNVGVSGPGTVECHDCKTESPAEAVAMEEMIRIEGASDPADQEMVAGVVCPACGTKGTLVLSYGANASAEDGEVARRLKDVRTPATT